MKTSRMSMPRTASLPRVHTAMKDKTYLLEWSWNSNILPVSRYKSPFLWFLIHILSWEWFIISKHQCFISKDIQASTSVMKANCLQAMHSSRMNVHIVHWIRAMIIFLFWYWYAHDIQFFFVFTFMAWTKLTLTSWFSPLWPEQKIKIYILFVYLLALNSNYKNIFNITIIIWLDIDSTYD